MGPPACCRASWSALAIRTRALSSVMPVLAIRSLLALARKLGELQFPLASQPKGLNSLSTAVSVPLSVVFPEKPWAMSFIASLPLRMLECADALGALALVIYGPRCQGGNAGHCWRWPPPPGHGGAAGSGRSRQSGQPGYPHSSSPCPA